MKLTHEDIEMRVDREKHELNLSWSCASIFSPKITSNDMPLLCRYLKDNPDITTLDLRKNKINEEGAKLLAMNTTITMLNATHNNIRDEGAKALAANTTLRVLDIGYNSIGVEGAKALAANSTLSKLELGFNVIGNEGAKVLAANTTIAILGLKCNYIGARGAKKFALNSTLTALDVSCNSIGGDSILALATNTTIRVLDVAASNIGEQGALALAANTTIEELNIRANKIGVKGVKALAANTTIKILDVSNTFESNEGAGEFVRELKKNFSLVKLSHDFSDRGINQTIKKILARNKALPWLHTIRHARLLAQAQRSENCSLGTLPIEVLGMINNYVVGANHFSFFVTQFDKRPTAQDLITAKQMGLT